MDSKKMLNKLFKIAAQQQKIIKKLSGQDTSSALHEANRKWLLDIANKAATNIDLADHKVDVSIVERDQDQYRILYKISAVGLGKNQNIFVSNINRIINQSSNTDKDIDTSNIIYDLS